jgi:hypothetical protein
VRKYHPGVDVFKLPAAARHLYGGDARNLLNGTLQRPDKTVIPDTACRRFPSAV